MCDERATSTLTWREAAIKVLRKNKQAMHYSDIAREIVENNMRKAGATPAISLNTALNLSLRNEGARSPFVRVAHGEYFLKELEDAVDSEPETSTLQDEGSETLIKAFGMFWERDLVQWRRGCSLIGRQQVNSDSVDFSNQRGIYILYDGKEVIYAGRSIDRPMGDRLFEHTQDRLRGRWNRFSWFGVLSVKDDGVLGEMESSFSSEKLMETFEAVLIEVLEPPLNRKRGDGFSAIEYLQVTDPNIEREEVMKLLNEVQRRMMNS